MISVIMGVYNETKLMLSQAIDSIISQTYTNWELLIFLDNPQNREIYAHLISYEKFDSRIKIFINEKNIGLANTLNKGLSYSKSEFIARMDADDISLPLRFEKEMLFLKAYPEVGMVSTNCIFIDDDGVEQGSKTDIPEEPEIIKQLLPYGSTIIHPSVIIRKSVIKKVGGYRLLKTSEDYDLWLRILSSEIEIGSINEALIKYRIRANSMSNSDRMLNHLTDKYIRKLYIERKSGTDTYSKENYEFFLKNNGYYNMKKRLKFNESDYVFQESMRAWRNASLKVKIRIIIELLPRLFQIYEPVLSSLNYKFKKRTLRSREID